MLGVLLFGAVSCALGLLDPPSEIPNGGGGRQLLDLIRVLSTAALAVSLLSGPGIVWRANARRHRPGLGFVFLPGIFILAGVGGIAWVLVVLGVVALQQAHNRFPWSRSKLVRTLLTLRVGELLLIGAGPTLATTHIVISSSFGYTDTIALLGMAGFAALLARLVWIGSAPIAEQGVTPDVAQPPGEQTRTG